MQATSFESTVPEANSVPVSFINDTPEAEVTMEVMDLSVGDLVSVRGPDVCPWDGTSSAAGHSMPGLVSTALNFSPEAAQREQADTAEQAVQTALPSQSMQSMRSGASGGLELPLNCRVAARVSTKLPPLDHEPQLPPLPENFILPPEMHPVLGKYSYQGHQSTQTSPTASSSTGNSPRHAAEGKWLHCKRTAPEAGSRYVGIKIIKDQP